MNDRVKPNIVLIMTDQQRYDTIGAAGFDHMITPNLDKLAQEGTQFHRAYCPGATCIASRAAIFTGMYPHNTGVYSFDKWSHHLTWVEDLASNGYHCVNLGKMHIEPLYAGGGFDERRVVENKAAKFLERRRPSDEWSNFLLDHGMKRPNDRHRTDPDWLKKHNAIEWEFEERFHSDVYVGNMACNWLKQWDQLQPLFLQIGFPGPHEPYDPPKRYLDLYDHADIPDPVYAVGELERKPPQHKALQEHFKHTKVEESVIHMEQASDDDIKRMRKHYYANITLIDDMIGNIIGILRDKGMLDNTVLLFTTDHGDNLGDHKLAYKWLMYDTVTRVPFIVKDFRAASEGAATVSDVHELVSLIDIGPTVLTYAGCELPSYLEGVPLQNYINGKNHEDPYPYVFCEDNYMIMMRSKTHKLVYYIGQPYGELYDLENDPWELHNLWDAGDLAGVKLQMKEDLLDWLGKSCYFNGRYKSERSKRYAMRYPDHPDFGNKLQGRI